VRNSNKVWRMARLHKLDGVVYRRNDSNVSWMRYRLTSAGPAAELFPLAPRDYWRNCWDALQIHLSPKHLPFSKGFRRKMREAAVYLGVSVRKGYLWVERKQIPHLRVMGRNIRFLKSDLEPFRATFKQEVGIGKTE
jgi:excisionase family DNA binding protein